MICILAGSREQYERWLDENGMTSAEAAYVFDARSAQGEAQQAAERKSQGPAAIIERSAAQPARDHSELAPMSAALTSKELAAVEGIRRDLRMDFERPPSDYIRQIKRLLAIVDRLCDAGAEQKPKAESGEILCVR